MLQSMGSQRIRHSLVTEQQEETNGETSLGSPVVKTLCFQCRGQGSISGW